MNFKKGDRVVKVMVGGGARTAVIEEVAKVTKDGVVSLVDTSITYKDASGNEINPGLPGFSSHIIVLEE